MNTKIKVGKNHSLNLIILIRNVIIAICIIAGIIYGVHVINHLELYSTTAKFQLIQDIEDGDPEALRIYERYIGEDKYFYNGSVSLLMMAEKYNLDYDGLRETYLGSDYETIQEFFDNYVNKIVNETK